MPRPVNSTSPSFRTLRSPEDLLQAGLIAKEETDAIRHVAEQYATAIPPAFAELIGHPSDPIGLQVIPSAEELITTPEERSDPIGDEALSPVPGIVHRYADRVLLKPTLICPLYCRFCFRREHVGPSGGLLTEAQLETALDWLRNHEEIREVILTGGDPLMLSPRRLRDILSALEEIPHITTLRLHTRVPVAAPERITQDLLESLETRRVLWIAIHANHAREFSPDALRAISDLRRKGLPLLGQSVLLRGVNDNTDSLEALLRAMVEAGIKPYYLHHLDPAPGTARFAVPVEEGQALLRSLRGRVTGLAWPTYVLDIPGGHGKVPLSPEYLSPDENTVEDPSGQRHVFRS
ncbi:lysine-2,3-aminomutase-like protein [Acetobacter sp. AN02]|uniref:lysine-2,3-aminomutase-like protein n=1 Tax=Acetobacter sp. AN02 TaxID=2894186 RepID=UPI0024345FBF|nr:lysine-2,3-aminomutase-like protein [Acetobacter sp. AN02]MDG6094758.1 lysine-2,3-aminomutase-like protein [Acetobacter sp. AN02]